METERIEPKPALRLILVHAPDDPPLASQEFQKNLSEFVRSLEAEGIKVSSRRFAFDAVHGGGGLLNEFTLAAESLTPLIITAVCAAVGGYLYGKRGRQVTFEMTHLGIKGSAQTPADAEELLQGLLDASQKLPQRFRTKHTSEWRAGDVRHTIDPGFVHFRKIQTILGERGMQIVDERIRSLPPELPDFQRQIRIQHIYSGTMLDWCAVNGVRTLGDVLAKRNGRIFCSNVQLGPCAYLFTQERATNEIVLDSNYAARVELRYSTRHIFGDTPRERLRDGGFVFSVIAELSQVEEETVVFDPVVMGAPWLEVDERGPYQSIEWYAAQFYEHYVEDFDEFAKVRDVTEPLSPQPMSAVSEAAFKVCLAEILGDVAQKDWGGETSDYYTSHVRLQGRRVTAAFLLKGPARFEPMGLNNLGKNNDQIVRLASEPADVLIVQHCHDILPAVRQTLRAFAVQPGRPRRYCLIDGRDSLRLLMGYGLYEKAVKLSLKE